VTTDPGRLAMPKEDPYHDIEPLIRATHQALVGAAFRLLGNRADAEDAVQEGCIKAMRHWSTLGKFQTAKQQRAYLFTVVVNEALQIIRQPYRRRERLESGQPEGSHLTGQPAGAGQQEAGHEAGEQLRLVWKAISELPEGCREVVILFAAGYEYPEIAEALGVQVSTVRSHMSNARKQLPRPTPDELEGGPE
jgi:RNA polymerase sigma-70 factor (ECF subfamily)